MALEAEHPKSFAAYDEFDGLRRLELGSKQAMIVPGDDTRTPRMQRTLRDIDVHPEYRDRGVLNAVLDVLSDLSEGYEAVYVEAIVNMRLLLHLMARGYRLGASDVLYRLSEPDLEAMACDVQRRKGGGTSVSQGASIESILEHTLFNPSLGLVLPLTETLPLSENQK